jgi:hypothetical protein
MATKKQALYAIEAAAVRLDEEMADLGNYTLDAPTGYVFVANNEPSYFAGQYDRFDAQYGFGPKMSEIYDDLIMACRMGIVEGEGSE